MVEFVDRSTGRWVVLHLQLLILEDHLDEFVVLVEKDVDRVSLHVLMSLDILEDPNLCSPILGIVLHWSSVLVDCVPLVVFLRSSLEYRASLNLAQFSTGVLGLVLVLLNQSVANRVRTCAFLRHEFLEVRNVGGS